MVDDNKSGHSNFFEEKRKSQFDRIIVDTLAYGKLICLGRTIPIVSAEGIT